jgi:signal transduction histidine kinase
MERSRCEVLEKLLVSQHRRAQEEKLSTVERGMLIMAHEFVGPSAFLEAIVKLLLDQEGAEQAPISAEERRDWLQNASQAVARIRQNILGIREPFYKGATYEPTECALADVVEVALRASWVWRGWPGLMVDVPRELPAVYVVPRRLSLAIVQLLVNAEHALRASEGKGELRVLGSVEGSSVVLLVEDNGPSFSPDVLPHLFEAFFTTKEPEKGSGLGLVLARELVEQSGGSLTAENRADGGARLRIKLPACASRSSDAVA